MNQTVIVDTYINKGTKLSDVGHDARYYHAYLQILNGLDGGIKLKLLHLASWVKSGFVELGHDIGKRRHAYFATHILPYVYLFLQGFVLYQLLYRHTLIFGHSLYKRVTLRVNGAVVQRISCSRNAEETGTLLISRRT